MKTRPTHAALIAIIIVLAAGIILIGLSSLSKHVANTGTVATSTATSTTAAPVTMSTADWRTGSDAAHALTFKYPADLGTQYLHASDWPPKLSVATTSPSCVAKENEMGKTGPRAIAGAQYCVTELSEGAAGSTYTTYTYVTQAAGKNVSLSFTIRYVQCDNYDEPQRTQCHAERDAFKVDDLVAKMVGTIQGK